MKLHTVLLVAAGAAVWTCASPTQAASVQVYGRLRYPYGQDISVVDQTSSTTSLAANYSTYFGAYNVFANGGSVPHLYASTSGHDMSGLYQGQVVGDAKVINNLNFRVVSTGGTATMVPLDLTFITHVSASGSGNDNGTFSASAWAHYNSSMYDFNEDWIYTSVTRTVHATVPVNAWRWLSFEACATGLGREGGSFQASADLDPWITLGAGYTSGYAIEIENVPAPEPSALATGLGLTGLSGLT